MSARNILSDTACSIKDIPVCIAGFGSLGKSTNKYLFTFRDRSDRLLTTQHFLIRHARIYYIFTDLVHVFKQNTE